VGVRRFVWSGSLHSGDSWADPSPLMTPGCCTWPSPTRLKSGCHKMPSGDSGHIAWSKWGVDLSMAGYLSSASVSVDPWVCPLVKSRGLHSCELGPIRETFFRNHYSNIQSSLILSGSGEHSRPVYSHCRATKIGDVRNDPHRPH
jgi:hypothetical protein